MKWIKAFGALLAILTFVLLTALVVEVQAQTSAKPVPTSSPALAYPTWDMYNAVKAERDACCNAPPGNVPTPYAAENVVRPVAKPVTNTCIPAQQKTDLDRRQQNHVYSVDYNIHLYAVKIAAVKETTTSGGVPADCWVTIRFGNYVSAQGYYGVFAPVRETRAEAEKDQNKYTAMGYCNTKIYELVITGNVDVPLYVSEGTYVQRE